MLTKGARQARKCGYYRVQFSSTAQGVEKSAQAVAAYCGPCKGMPRNLQQMFAYCVWMSPQLIFVQTHGLCYYKYHPCCCATTLHPKPPHHQGTAHGCDEATPALSIVGAT